MSYKGTILRRWAYLLAVACIVLAGCSDDGFIGDPEALTAGEITFSQSVPSLTRTSSTGAEAAAKLSNQFVVYGFKNETGKAEDTSTAENDEVVFANYTVKYTEGSANTTLSNTHGWEYVGMAADQFIKYWDFNTARYVFSAISGNNVTLHKITTAANAEDKGWTVTVPAGATIDDLSSLYGSDRREIKKSAKSGGQNSFETVTFTFYSLVTKVRFGIYETVPGYSVTIDRCYYDQTAATPTGATAFALDGSFNKPDASKPTEFNVVYASTADKAKPVSTTSSGLTVDYAVFGSDIIGQTVGTASNTATYDQADGEYSILFPYLKADNELKLMIDYTLTSTDGSDEEIRVHGATAVVPATYTQWQNGYAYTYLFKISDKTNGHGGDSDPEGLYPISFDAVVVSDADQNQETISSVTTPSITTYQAGQIVTNNDEYVTGIIYYSAMTNENQTNISGSHVYEVYNNVSNKALTEQYVADYKNNELVLIEIGKTMQTSVAGSTFADYKCYSFTAEAGKTYAINCGTGWKIVKVVGTYTAPAFKFKHDVDKDKITTADGVAEFTLNKIQLDQNNNEVETGNVIDANSLIKIYDSSDVDVTGLFTITDAGSGTYTFKPTDACIAAGANGTYTVKFNTDKATATFTIDLTYALSPTTVTILSGQTSSDILFTINNTAASGTVVNSYAADGITVSETATTGTYTVTAALGCSYKAEGYTVTIGGIALTVHVEAYTLTASAASVARGGSTTLSVTKNGTADTFDASSVSVFTSSGTTATGFTVAADGTVTVGSSVPVGTYTIKYTVNSVVVATTTLKVTTAP